MWSWWWDDEQNARQLRQRIARLEAENAELARRYPSLTNIVVFPNGEPVWLPQVADGTRTELGNSEHIMRKTNENGA